MIYVFLSRSFIVLDNIIYAIAIKRVELFSLIILWVLSAAILSNLVLFFVRKKRTLELSWVKKHPYQLLGYFVSSIFGIIFWGLAILNGGIGTAVIISRMESLILIIIGIIFFNETLNLKQKIATGLMILGTLLFAYKGSINIHMGVIFGLISTVFFSTQKILNKTLAKHIDSQIVVAIRTIIMTISISLFVCFSKIEFQMIDDYFLLLLIFIGGSSGSYISKYFNFKALETVPLSIFTLWSMVPPVVVFTISIIFLGEVYELHRIIAGGIILSGAFLLIKKKNIKLKT